MALPKPPDPLSAFAKTLFGHVPDPGWPWVNLYDYYHLITASGGSTWRRFKVRTVDQPSGLTADDAYWSIDIVNYTNGQIDDTWNDADYNTAIGQISNIIVLWQSYMHTNKEVTEISSYVMEFNPDYVVGQKGSNPFKDSGPPERTYAQAHAGAAGGDVLPPQAALSVTKLVASRKHWGRFYLPFLAANTLAGDAQGNASMVDAVANTTHAAFSALASAQLYPVVASTQEKGTAAMTLHQISGVQVDSNIDVIRRRRAHTTRYKKTL